MCFNWLMKLTMRRIGPWLLPVLGLFGAFAVIFERRVDPDFGWHLQAGRYILAHGVPAHDIFTYTAAHFSWINHEWLSDVVTAGLFRVGGFWLVDGVFAAIWTAAIVIAARSRRWPVLAVGFAGVIPYLVARPNAWTALLLAVLLWMLERGWRWPVVGLFGLWANLHGGFVVGLATVALAALRDRRYWWVLGAAILATFVNPYGPRLYVEVWRTLADANLHYNVGEWQPLSINILNGFYIVVYLCGVAALGWRRRSLVLPSLLLASAIGSTRQFPLFVVASLRGLGEGYGRMVDMLHIRRGWRSWLLPLVATGLVVVPTLKIALNPHNDLPYREVADLRETPCVGRVFNEYDFGGYIIWQLPGTKVYIDGRMPSWRSGGMDYFANWRGVLFDAAVARREFARYDVGCAILERKHVRLTHQLRDEGWRITSEDSLAVVMRRP
jgi:hypothetical protein